MKAENDYWIDKKVLVTGGSGFIGSHLAERLVELGARVAVYDNFVSGRVRNISHLKDEIEIVRGDIRDFKKLAKIIKNMKTIFHLAAISNPRQAKEKPFETFTVNVFGSLNVLLAAITNDEIERLVFASTVGVYGAAQYVPIDEGHPINSFKDPYSTSKLMAEHLFNCFNQTYNLPTVILRLTNNYGPKQREGFLVPTVIIQALTKNTVEIWDSTPTRDFIYAEDTVDAFLRSAERDEAVGQTYNIGTQKETRVGDLAKEITSLVNNGKYRNDSVSLIEVRRGKIDLFRKRVCICSKKIRAELGWNVKTPLDEGLKSTVDWYYENLNDTAQFQGI